MSHEQAQALSDALLADEGACAHRQSCHPFLTACLAAGPFAATLARQLATLVSSHKLLPGMGVWAAAVDGLLLRAVSVSSEVHEEARLSREESGCGIHRSRRLAFCRCSSSF